MPKTLAQRAANVKLGAAVGSRDLQIRLMVKTWLELANEMVFHVLEMTTPATRANVRDALEPQLADLERKISMLHRYASRGGKDAASTSPAVTPPAD
jgi:hypothetical protein